MSIASLASAQLSTGPLYAKNTGACIASGGVTTGGTWSQVKTAIEAGGTVRILASELVVTEPVTIPSSTTIVAHNCATVTLTLIASQTFIIADGSSNISIQGLTVRNNAAVDSWLDIGDNVTTVDVKYNDVDIAVNDAIIQYEGEGLDALTVERNTLRKYAGNGAHVSLVSCDLKRFADPADTVCFNDTTALTAQPTNVSILNNLFAYGFVAESVPFAGGSNVRVHGFGSGLLIKGNQFGERSSGIIGARSHLALTGVARAPGVVQVDENTYYCDHTLFAGAVATGPCVRVGNEQVDASGVSIGESAPVIFERELWFRPYVDPTVDRNRSGRDANAGLAECDGADPDCSRYGAYSGPLGLGAERGEPNARADVTVSRSVVVSDVSPVDRLAPWTGVDFLRMDHVTWVSSGFRAETPSCAHGTFDIENSIFSGVRVQWQVGPTCLCGLLNTNLVCDNILEDKIPAANTLFASPEFLSTTGLWNFNLGRQSPGIGHATDGLDAGAFHRFIPTAAISINDPTRVVVHVPGAAFDIAGCESALIEVTINAIPANVTACDLTTDMTGIPYPANELIAVFIDQVISTGDQLSIVLTFGAVQDELAIGGEAGSEIIVNSSWSQTKTLAVDNQITDVIEIPAVSFTFPSWLVDESVDQLSVCLQIPNPAAIGFTAQIIFEGTAANGTDYTSTGTASFAQGSQKADVLIDLIDDTLIEGDETILMRLAAGTGYSIGAQSSHLITVTDDDSEPEPPPVLNSLHLVNIELNNVEVGSQ